MFKGAVIARGIADAKEKVNELESQMAGGRVGSEPSLFL
jgi:hypothetical protein